MFLRDIQAKSGIVGNYGIFHAKFACNTVGPVLNAWFNNCVLRFFFAYIENSMIARVDAAMYGVLILDLLLIANCRKTRISHLIDTHTQNQSYVGIYY